ncbi:FxDxF family PEP-CTERM protein [Rhodoferax sp.]|uniref:FxDxF family PEP-CTERM protein n=1 Tax=Rhodoferax sp. TaxID=50421 RepID=UPI001ECC07F9|nr:FxDxF family PEP-CTERM protein [Rhodoferax sp.]MBT9507785.1 PEP-CTERM sorting domain-containing protein [Rhodoferax sp.]
MGIKKITGAVLIALSSFTANAASTSPVQVAGPAFADIELGSFNLTGTSDVVGTLGFAPYVLIAPGFQIALPSVSFSAISAYNSAQAVTTVGLLAGDAFVFSGLSSGLYKFMASGSLMGSNFIGAQYTVTPVPEPETFAMLLAGLGVVCALGRRRGKLFTTTKTAQ